MYRLAAKRIEKRNRRNHCMVSSTAKRIENVSGTFLRQWYSVRRNCTSGVYERCKQTVSSTIGLLSDSYALVYLWRFIN